jgi:hypothetical protein
MPASRERPQTGIPAPPLPAKAATVVAQELNIGIRTKEVKMQKLAERNTAKRDGEAVSRNGHLEEMR